MPLRDYDPHIRPDAEAWSALDETDAFSLVTRYHGSPGCEHPPAPNPHLHTALHVVVENQAALGDETPVAATIERLMREGLNRHDAVHAVGSVLAEHIYELLKGQRPATAAGSTVYYDELRALTAESWLRSGDVEQAGEPDRLTRADVLANDETEGTPAAFARLSDDDLLGLLFTEEDRLPRPAVDEILSRRHRLTGALIAVIIDPRNWNVPRPAWWATVHATFILGAIDDPIGDAALFSAMRDAEVQNCDWISMAMPSILGRRGRRVRDILSKITADSGEEPPLRVTALSALAATTLQDGEENDHVFAEIGRMFTDTSNDRYLRGHAGNVLLDFQVEEHRAALVAFAREEAGRQRDKPFPMLAFTEEDIGRAFSASSHLDTYRKDWLSFYDADQIASRQERWAREDAKREQAHTRPRALRIKAGRNDPCPCGSGKKYKKCCLGREPAA
jgi:hypothetical protein